ncbi:tripartite tricarboxylate transporter TctB family protein [Roseobacter sp.]|uniref:tripartite tricarboxylate transporter TctB family protein n=1 Tax=Roseobacter sp. TaxID=1907202 RepID=UPI00385B8187
MTKPCADPACQHRTDLCVGLPCGAFAFTALLLIPVKEATDGWTQFANVLPTAISPLWAGTLLLVLSVGMVVRSFRHGDDVRRPRHSAVFHVILTSTTLGVSRIALFWVGFLATVTLLIAALAVIFGEKRALCTVLLSGLVSLVVYVVFLGKLSVILPVEPF